ncbi:Lysophosphatidic acid phosphatase type 6 [Hondaea fermentalgiana]|uniref:Lysophosphatidic acid phosphatase type 6 n=1 Tax=Hondaea fermentalgiana TaxID=2315210 RepID=A0A2R5GL56_9STRA|nr:Lysophosphatidic acid phosphatase type 6 [Hondaea fermentalgiana]|eukprot:GBG31636.1 Lysophosphatidic acid phosphatase type 6 [Hondaea fermentalgiana]
MEVPAKRFGAFMLSVFRDEFFARDAHGKSLPEGADEVKDLLGRLQRLDAARIRSMFSGGSSATRDEATRLHAGRMLIRIVESLNAAPDEAHRLIVHSGHDWTIIMLLMGLDPEGTDARTRDWPPFCSDLVFERWEDAKAGKEYVRVVLNGEALKLHHLVPHPKYPSLYTKESLHDALEPFVLAEHQIEEACKLPAEK